MSQALVEKGQCSPTSQREQVSPESGAGLDVSWPAVWARSVSRDTGLREVSSRDVTQVFPKLQELIFLVVWMEQPDSLPCLA